VGSFCAQLVAGAESIAPSPPSVANRTRITSMAASPRGRCTRWSTFIAGVVQPHSLMLAAIAAI
jgi:hypothetical protein